MGNIFKKSSKAIALDQIKQFGGTHYDENKIHLGQPQVLDIRVDILDDENTYVDARFVDDQNIISDNKDGFLYRRLLLDNILHNKTLITYKTLPFSTHILLDDINREYNLALTENEITNKVINSVSDVVTFKTHSDNLAWISGDIVMMLDIKTPLNYRMTEESEIRYTEDGLPREIN